MQEYKNNVMNDKYRNDKLRDGSEKKIEEGGGIYTLQEGGRKVGCRS
jgi:hypothetical protein